MRRTSLTTRLVAAFALVAVAALAALAVAIVLGARSETSRLAAREQRAAAAAIARELGDAYAKARGWRNADLGGAIALARQADAVLVVRDGAGRIIEDLRPGTANGAGRALGAGPGRAPTLTRSVRARGREVGTVELHVRRSLSRAEQALRDALADRALIGSLAALAIALVVALLVARQISRPLRRTTAALRRVRAGDRAARAAVEASGDLGELAQAFDEMAADLEREECARRDLVADVRHELRTPITILRANLEELVDGIEEPTPQRLASLNEEVVRLDALVGDLDAMITADVAALRLRRAPVDIAEVVAREVDAMRPQFADKGVSLDAHLEPVVLDADRSRLGQIVANLLSNALKFTPAGGEVHVTLHDGPVARLAVSDTGSGIAPADQGRVFTRFARGQNAVGVAGRGIGLAVVDELVRAHGGTVELHSVPGSGTTLEVHLPGESVR